MYLKPFLPVLVVEESFYAFLVPPMLATYPLPLSLRFTRRSVSGTSCWGPSFQLVIVSDQHITVQLKEYTVCYIVFYKMFVLAPRLSQRALVKRSRIWIRFRACVYKMVQNSIVTTGQMYIIKRQVTFELSSMFVIFGFYCLFSCA